MRYRSGRRGGRAAGVWVVGILAIGATTLVTDVPVAGGAVSATTPWALMKTPYLFGTHTEDSLGGVSCPTTLFCIAVGGTGSLPPGNAPSKPLAEEWTGGKTSSWKLMTTTGLPATNAGLERISCSSTTYCMAIGNGSGDTFAALWNGSVWSLTPSLTPSVGALWSVSCPSTDCVATGTVLTNGTSSNTMIADSWDGQTWTSTALSGSPGTLAGVSCFSAAQCLAVGSATPAGSRSQTLAQYFDNGTWTAESPLNPYPTYDWNSFNAAGCEQSVTPTTCVAVGVGGPTDFNPIAETWNASTGVWSVTTPNTSTEGFDAVSCPTTSWCVATTGQGGPPDAQAWNGSTWTLMNTKAVSGTSSDPANWFSGVSCPSSTFCVAVGSKTAFVGQQPEIASWGTVP